jgi:predicted  nucleic acid-binding Zn-ribbon protein
MHVSIESMRTKALSLVRQAATKSPSGRARLEFLAMALAGKKMSSSGFGKVIKMIDDMVALLKDEQVADDNKKQYCLTEFDNADDKKKALERKLSLTQTAIETTQDGIATLTDEIAALVAAIKALDKDVAEATAQRQAENKAFTEMIASDSAAKELLGLAKNRLNQFYNPKLYKPAPKAELSAQERILVSQGGTASPTPAPAGIAGTGVTVFADVSAHSQENGEVAPPPPPATWDAYAKKSGESTGVIAMIDLLVKDLTKEMTEGKTTEADAQADYEQMMRDMAEKRVEDSDALAEKQSAKAGLESDLAALNDEHASATRELGATLEYIASLHGECDWLLKYFDVRKEARSGEIDSLVSAKAVLSGADYSLVEVTRSNLRGHQ